MGTTEQHSAAAQRAEADRRDVACVLAGDTAAFEGIVRRWQAPLIHLAYRFCRDRGRSEEMAQEAFLRAFCNLAGWRQQAAFSTWLFALATNLYCTQLRQLPPVTLPFDEVHEPVDPNALDAGFEERSRRAAVRKAVDSLPAKYREVLTLYYFHEMDVPAAAASLGLPEGTVKVRLFRARKLLHGKLTPLMEDVALPRHEAKESL
ncbi:MAG TPA: sigma-70 family RNA polymerase sigma factor [Acidobacteriaceae bacterium]|nr:sigma-70 family RNA polymerase sigma factor [Acidobacteriaceae bacterium]